MLCFRSPFIGHGKGLFIAPAVTSVLRSCPLTAFVWSGCTYRPHCVTPTLTRQRRTCFIPLCVVAFLPATILMPSLSTFKACTQRFPLKLPLLGGLSSQQDVPPKRGLSRGRKWVFSPLPTTKPHPLYLLPLTHGPTMSCIGWVQAGGAWALRVLPSQICPRGCLLLMCLP